MLDRSIVASFGRAGFVRHARAFEPGDLEARIEGRIVLVTGANAGLGRATVLGLARMGATVHMLCRSAARGSEALEAIRAETGSSALVLHTIDVSSIGSIQGFVSDFPEPRVDVLVNNAGVLPSSRELTPEGYELTWATNVLGPFALTAGLLPKLGQSDDARVITVSSGGMYLQPLDLDDLEWERRRFDGVRAYANSKRAQVVLNEQWAARFAPDQIAFSAMHPGWADTGGVKSSLPRFHRLTRRILRSAEQGADTIVWLAGCPRLRGDSGRFWFDRRPAATDVLRSTRVSESSRNELWRRCVEASGDLGAGLSAGQI